MAAVRMSHEERSTQLLDVAEELFTTRGYDRVSIEDVARAAGVSRPVVYQHHGSKEGLLLACADRARLEFERDVRKAHEAAGGDFTAFVERGGVLLYELHRKRPTRWALLFSNAVGEGGPLASKLSDQRFTTIAMVGHLAGDYAPDIDPMDLQAFAVAVSGVSEALSRWSQSSAALSREQFLRYFRVFTLSAIRAVATLARDGASDSS